MLFLSEDQFQSFVDEMNRMDQRSSGFVAVPGRMHDNFLRRLGGDNGRIDEQAPMGSGCLNAAAGIHQHRAYNMGK